MLAVAVALVVFQAVRTRTDGSKPSEPVAGPAATVAPTAAIKLAPTEVPQSPAQPTEAEIVGVPTVDLQPTVEVKITLPPTSQAPQAPAGGVPGAVPVPAGGLEQLPVMVATALPGVPPDQLPRHVPLERPTASID